MTGYVSGGFVEGEIILFDLTSDLLICGSDHLNIGADPKWVEVAHTLSLLSCAKQFFFFLISYIFFLLGWIFQEKDVPDWGVPNIGKCSTCQMFALLLVHNGDFGEVCLTMFLLNLVAKEEEPYSEPSICRQLHRLVNCCPSSPKHLPLLNFWSFVNVVALAVITDLIFFNPDCFQAVSTIIVSVLPSNS